MMIETQNYISLSSQDSSSSFCNETTGRVRKSLNRKMNNRFRDITVNFIFNTGLKKKNH